MRISNPGQSDIAHDLKPRRTVPFLAGILVAFILSVGPLFAAAQQPGSQSPAVQASAHKTVHARRRPTKVPPPDPTPPTAPAPAVPAAPVLPDWPVNDRPVDATVVWNSQGLRIEAANSSLSQIMKDVSTLTGATVEGLGPGEHSSDQRIFGSYGPGPARDVLSQLLVGSGYNVLMVGDQGQGTPREIVLSARPTGDAPPVANSQPTSNDENAEADEQQQQQQLQPQPPPIRNGFAPGAPPRTPQQIMQEMQQRQQQMQQNAAPQ